VHFASVFFSILFYGAQHSGHLISHLKLTQIPKELTGIPHITFTLLPTATPLTAATATATSPAATSQVQSE